MGTNFDGYYDTTRVATDAAYAYEVFMDIFKRKGAHITDLEAFRELEDDIYVEYTANEPWCYVEQIGGDWDTHDAFIQACIDAKKAQKS